MAEKSRGALGSDGPEGAGPDDTARVSIIRYSDETKQDLTDIVVKEKWLDLYVNGRPVLQTPFSGPGETAAREIATGHLTLLDLMPDFDRRLGGRTQALGMRIESSKTHGKYSLYVDVPSEVKNLTVLLDELFAKVEEGGGKAERFFETESSRWSPQEILALAGEFARIPSLFQKTGGVHTAAFARDRILIFAEDVSRRNAVDKLIGRAVLAGQSLEGGILLSSGRVSSDAVFRAARLRIPIIVSKSAPTDKAVGLAEACGITLCGFVRGQRMNVYAQDRRISSGF